MKSLASSFSHIKSRIPSRTRSAYICSRLLYQCLPARARASIGARIGHSWKFLCPACGDRIRAFSPLPEFYFQELEEHDSDLRTHDFETLNSKAYQCPHCGASDRDRLYALYLDARLRVSGMLSPEFFLLDIAPSAALAAHIRRVYAIRYRTADLFQKGVDDRVDITSMRCYEDATFDAFICSHVLEHVQDDKKAMAELFRILKPGGWGIAMAPIDLALKEIREDPAITTPAERWRHFGQGDHVRVYSRDGFTDRLKEAGFVVRQFGSGYFGLEQMRTHGLSEASVLYVVEKPDPH
jgi:SAM-dependent methyltransferase